MNEMKQTALAVGSNLYTLAADFSALPTDISGASFVFFARGAVLQRETDVVSFGDLRSEWNEHIVEHYAPLLAPCALMARMEDKPIECRLAVRPTREVTIPLCPKANLIPAPREEYADPAGEG